MKKQFQIGHVYTIQFWDHCKGEEKILCEVTIEATKEDETFVYGTWWRIITKDKELASVNHEMISIVKSAIVKKNKVRGR
jgi:hypothetical protein